MSSLLTKFRVGDAVRDVGRYPFDCDGIVVCTTRFFWERARWEWRKERSQYDLVVKFHNGDVKFYDRMTEHALIPWWNTKSCGKTLPYHGRPLTGDDFFCRRNTKRTT